MLSQATGNAAMALSFLAASGGKPMLVREIATACDLPAPYLSKIVHHLARADLVITQRGVGGGVQLAVPPESISLYKLCEVLGDPAIECRCMLGNAECSQERACPAHKFWSECRRQQLEFLQTTMISDLADYELRARFAGPQPAEPSEDAAAARA
ncbi:MAG: Rrf2 family transcriptional regulator [Planctomycetota bacterium]